jgi:hypothetical protein
VSVLGLAVAAPKSGLTKMRGPYYRTNAQALPRGVLETLGARMEGYNSGA